MRKKFKSRDIFDDLEPKEKSPIIPIAIFVSVVIIICVVAVFAFSLLAEHTDLEVPWSSGNKTNNKGNVSSSRDQMKLVTPSIRNNEKPSKILGAEMELLNIKSDEYGFLITVGLTTVKNEYTTIEVNQVNLDGFYFTTTFAISDRIDYDENGVRLANQKATEYEFRIKKTELDDIGMFGFNNIRLIMDAENDRSQSSNIEFFRDVNNDLNVVNERKGLIRIDEKNQVAVSYYKTITANDGTYIYFDFQNTNKKDMDIYVKELIVNNKVYEMKSFKETTYRLSQKAIYLFIPKKDIERVNTIRVRFYLVEENAKAEKSFYITNEYSRAY